MQLRDFLEIAEWVTIYFSWPEFNKKKTVNPPKRDVYLINEWFKPNKTAFGVSERRLKNIGIMKAIMDVECWSPTTQLIREGNLKVFSH